MSSNLIITFFCRSTFLIAGSFQNRVFSETLFDGKQSLLHSAFLVKFLFPLFLLFLIICEQIQLYMSGFVGFYFVFTDNAVHGDIDATDKQLFVDYPVKQIY